MKTKLHTLIAITALGSGLALAQDQPRPPRNPEAPERPPLPDEPPRPPEGGFRRPDEARPREGTEAARAASRARAAGERLREFSGRLSGEAVAPGKPTPYLGVVTVPVPPAMSAQLGQPEGFGLLVEEVLADSPAKAAGIEKFDILKALGDQKLVEPGQFATLIRGEGKDKEVILTLLRKGQEQKVTVKVGEKMMNERGPFDLRLPGAPGGATGSEMQRRFEELRGSGGDRMKEAEEKMRDAGKKMQERMREFQERMKNYQKKMEEWGKDPNRGPAPEMPKLEGLSERAGAPPRAVLAETLPGGAPQVSVAGDGSTSISNTSLAHVSMHDESGSIEVQASNGHRTLVAKDASGKTVFDGPIDTEDQRRDIPPDVRRKLDKVQVRTTIEHNGTPIPAAPEAGRRSIQ